jgi:uncharacterized membrane protein
MKIFQILLIAITMLVLDFIFLGNFKNFFNRQIMAVQNDNITINYYGAIMCYLVMIFGLYYFIIKDKKPLLDAFILGLVIFSVYETTNLTLFNNWNYTTVIVDSIWGGILFTITTYVVYYFSSNNIDVSIVHPASL